MASTDFAASFHSALARTVASMGAIADKNGLVGAPQAVAWLASRQKEGKFKQAEFEAVGLGDYLELFSGKVPVADIAAFVEGNGVQVQEMVLGGDLERQYDAAADAVNNAMRDRLSEAEVEQLRDIRDDLRVRKDGGDQTKYAQYTVPGGENYREVLITLPTNKTLPNGYRIQQIEATEFDRALGVAQWWQVVRDGTTTIFAEAANREDAIEIALNNLGLANKGVYRSNHWGVPNVLAHLRMDDRTDADGNKVLFINEVQSDWGQDGKKKGFKQEYLSTVPTITAKVLTGTEFVAERGMPEAAAQFWLAGRNDILRDLGKPAVTLDDKFTAIYEDGIPKIVKDGALDADALAAKHRKSYEALSVDAQSRHAAEQKNKVPEAPFVTDTKAWVALAIKRTVMMAVEGGYEQVAFINGKQAADLYDLSTQIDRIDYTNNDGVYTLSAIKDGEEVISKEDLSIDEVAEVVGKEVAAKIERGEGFAGGDSVNRWEPEGSNVKYRSLPGIDLKIGGEGMQVFYDQIVPQVVRDVVKRLGGNGVAPIAVSQANRMDVLNTIAQLDYESDFDELSDRAQATVLAVAEDKLQAGHAPQMGFAITPAMREKVLEGVPLFSRSNNVPAPSAELKDWLGDSKLVDKAGKPLVVYHGTSSDFDSFDAQFQGKTAGVSGLGVAKINAEVAAIGARWAGMPPVHVVKSVGDLPFEAPSNADGAYHDNQVYVVVDNIQDLKQLQKVMAHECVMHHALEEMLGEYGFAKLHVGIQKLKAAGDPTICSLAANIKSRYVDLSPETETKEIVARAGELCLDEKGDVKVEFGFMKSVFAGITGWLRSHGIKVPFTNIELQGIMHSAGEWVKEGPDKNFGTQQNQRQFDLHVPMPSMSLKKSVAQLDKQLVLLHNLSEENLLHANDLGGLAAPSLALSRLDAPLENFGEISLIGDTTMAKPSAKNPVFNADVYSPRFPNVRVKVSKDKVQSTLAPLIEAAGKLDQRVGSINSAIADMERGQLGDAARILSYDNSLRLGFANAVMGKSLKVPMRRAEYKPVAVAGASIIEQSPLKEFLVSKPGDYLQSMPSHESQELATKVYVALINKHFAEAKDIHLPGSFAAEMQQVNRRIGLFAEHKIESGYSDISIDKIGMMRERGITALRSLQLELSPESLKTSPHSLQEVDATALKALLDKEAPQKEVRDWLRENLSSALGEKRILKDNGRTAAYSMDNIVREMTRQVQDAEGFNYGLGNVRSRGAEKFKNFPHIQSQLDRIVPSEEFESARKKLDVNFHQLSDKLEPYKQNKHDNVSELLSEAIGKSYSQNMNTALQGAGLQNVPADLQAKVSAFAQNLARAPTEYFEAKPQRAVGLDEFRGAVIPSDTSLAAREVLRKNGLQLQEYERGQPESRKEAVAKLAGGLHKAAGQVLFSFAGERAMSADLEALTVAQAGIEDGQDVEALRRETGWGQGVDGRWRFEISDNTAFLKGIGSFGDVVMGRLAALSGDGRAPGDPVRLGDILRHPVLFSAYPSLAKLEVEFMPFDKTARGRLGNDGAIQIQESLPSNEALSVILHELQHGIQEIEGFAVGGTPYAMDAIADNLREKQHRLRAFASAGSEDALHQLKEVDAEVALHGYDAMDAYKRLAGETEARNTQSRQSMTDEQRSATSPDLTADVPRNESIVFFRDTPREAPRLSLNIEGSAGFVARGDFSGMVLSVSDGVAVQRVSRAGDTVRHDVSRLSAAVAVGDVVDIGYRGGVGVVGGLDKNKGQGR